MMDSKYIEETEMLDEIKVNFIYDCLEIKLDFAGVWFFPGGSEYDFHMHSNYEFHYIKEGFGKVIIEDTEYQLKKGAFYVTGPGVLHKQLANDGSTMMEYGMKCDLILKDMIGRECESYSLEEYKELIRLLGIKRAYVVEDKNNIELLFESMFEEIRNKKVGYYSEINNYIFKILIASARNYDDNRKASYNIPKRDMDSFRMNLVISYISDNGRRNINREEIASVLGLSIRQLERIIKRSTSMSTHDFIISRKIQIIKEMLSSTDMTLLQIANLTGFSSEFHLSRTFKKNIGIPPLLYRKQKSAP